MKGDFSRVFEAETLEERRARQEANKQRDYVLSRVRLQQGRPLVDSDINEQFDILQGQLEDLVRGLMGGSSTIDKGCHGYFGPDEHEANFEVCVKTGTNGAVEIVVKPGTYYVDGMRCVLREELKLQAKRDELADAFVLLHVVERELTLEEARRHEPALAALPGVHSKVEFDIQLASSGQEGPIFPVRTPSMTATFTVEKSELLANALYRVEMHDAVVEDNVTKVRLKLAVDNAAHAFEVTEVTNSTVRLKTTAANASYLPGIGDWLEFETAFPKPALALLLITGVPGHGVFEVSGVPVDAKQARAWQHVEPIPVAGGNSMLKWKDIKDGPIRAVSVDISPITGKTSSDPDTPLADRLNKHRGYHWILPIRPYRRALESDDTQEFELQDVVGTGRFAREATIPLAHIAMSDGNGGVGRDHRLRFQIDGKPIPSRSCNDPPAVRPAAAGEAQPPDALGPGPATDQGASRPVAQQRFVTTAAAPAVSLELLQATPCRRLLPPAQTTVVNRWLASAEFGEVCGLSREDLRTRIERDCEAADYDQRELEVDIDMIVQHRTALLAGHRNSDSTLLT